MSPDIALRCQRPHGLGRDSSRRRCRPAVLLIREVEAGESQIGGQLGIHSKILNSSLEGQLCDLEKDGVALSDALCVCGELLGMEETLSLIHPVASIL